MCVCVCVHKYQCYTIAWLLSRMPTGMIALLTGLDRLHYVFLTLNSDVVLCSVVQVVDASLRYDNLGQAGVATRMRGVETVKSQRSNSSSSKVPLWTLSDRRSIIQREPL